MCIRRPYIDKRFFLNAFISLETSYDGISGRRGAGGGGDGKLKGVISIVN